MRPVKSHFDRDGGSELEPFMDVDEKPIDRSDANQQILEAAVAATPRCVVISSQVVKPLHEPRTKAEAKIGRNAPEFGGQSAT